MIQKILQIHIHRRRARGAQICGTRVVSGRETYCTCPSCSRISLQQGKRSHGFIRSPLPNSMRMGGLQRSASPSPGLACVSLSSLKIM